MTITITRKFAFDAAHRVMRHESKCATLHGHRYDIEVEVEAVSGELDSVGRVVDFGELKQKIGGWIDDNLDHTTIIGPDDRGLIDFCWNEHTEHGKRRPFVLFQGQGEPTAENIAAMLGHRVQMIVGLAFKVVRVTVWETPNCEATWWAS